MNDPKKSLRRRIIENASDDITDYTLSPYDQSEIENIVERLVESVKDKNKHRKFDDRDFGDDVVKNLEHSVLSYFENDPGKRDAAVRFAKEFLKDLKDLMKRAPVIQRLNLFNQNTTQS